MNPTKFIQPAFFKALFDKTGDNIIVKKEYKPILETLNLLGKANEIAEELKNHSNLPAPGPEQKLNNQEEIIAANVMPAINYILHSLQSFIVSSKQLMNWSAQKVLGQDTKHQLSFSVAEDLEVMRKELTKDSITIVQVANLFEFKNASLELKDGIEIPVVFQQSFYDIKVLLETELKKNGANLEEKLKQLQEGKDPHWYDFKFLEDTSYPKVVEIFKTCMSYITDLLIAATSISKGIVNYVYSFYKENEPLLPKTSAEIVSDLNRGRGNQHLNWAQLAKIIEQSKSHEQYEIV